MNIYDSPGLNPRVLIPLTLEFWLSVMDILPPERYCAISFSLLMVVVKRFRIVRWMGEGFVSGVKLDWRCKEKV